MNGGFESGQFGPAWKVGFQNDMMTPVVKDGLDPTNPDAFVQFEQYYA